MRFIQTEPGACFNLPTAGARVLRILIAAGLCRSAQPQSKLRPCCPIAAARPGTFTRNYRKIYMRDGACVRRAIVGLCSNFCSIDTYAPGARKIRNKHRCCERYVTSHTGERYVCFPSSAALGVTYVLWRPFLAGALSVTPAALTFTAAVHLSAHQPASQQKHRLTYWRQLPEPAPAAHTLKLCATRQA